VSAIIQIAPVRKTVWVKATPLRAFEMFTAGIDRWWPKTHGLGAAPLRESVIEPFVGGRWYSRHADGTDAVVGHVLVWQPAERFACTWHWPLQAGPWLAWIYLTTFGSLVAFSAYMLLLARTSTSVAASYTLVNPVVALCLGVTVGREQVSAWEWLAAAVVMIGVVLLFASRRPALQ